MPAPSARSNPPAEPATRPGVKAVPERHHTVTPHLIVKDTARALDFYARAFFAQALAAGASVVRPLADQFYGDRSGTLTDPFGHVWTLATHVEDVPPDELERRMQALFAK